jgi:hypothetical protein
MLKLQMNKTFIFIALWLFLNNLSAQRLVRITPSTPICTLNGDERPKDRITNSPSEEVSKTVANICRKMGVSSDLFIVEAANVQNAQAFVLEGKKRYIHYNPFYIIKIQQQTGANWAMIFAFAHEIGHHAHYHTLDTTNLDNWKMEELKADGFAGCALRHLGATLDEVEKAVSILSENGDATHPERSARLMATTRGWEDCKSGDKAYSPPIPTPSSDCQQKKTADVYFKNATKRSVRIFLSPQSGWRDMTPRLTLEAGETKAILDLGVGRQLLVIQILKEDALGNSSFVDYKNDEVRVNPCLDTAQSPIVIR